jgi:hypothetical protein
MNDIKDLDLIATALVSVGFRLSWSQAGPMDSGYAEFNNGKKIIKIVKDRSQWMLKESREILESLGQWRAFTDTSEFREALLDYIKKRCF